MNIAELVDLIRRDPRQGKYLRETLMGRHGRRLDRHLYWTLLRVQMYAHNHVLTTTHLREFHNMKTIIDKLLTLYNEKQKARSIIRSRINSIIHTYIKNETHWGSHYLYSWFHTFNREIFLILFFITRAIWFFLYFDLASLKLAHISRILTLILCSCKCYSFMICPCSRHCFPYIILISVVRHFGVLPNLLGLPLSYLV